MTSSAPDLQLRRGRELSPSQAWALLLGALVLAAGTVVRAPWLVPVVLAVALVAPGYVVVALAAASVEYDSGEGLWRTLALRLVTSVAVWTLVGTALVTVGVDPVVGVRGVALVVGALAATALVRHSRATGVAPAASLAGAVRSWRAVLGLRHVVVPVVAGAVLFGALGGAVALSRSGDPARVLAARTSSQAPFVALAVAGGAGTVLPDATGRSVVRVEVTGSRPATAADRTARLEVRVDGRVRTRVPVVVPDAGTVTVELAGDWGSCWRRASVALVPGAAASSATGTPTAPAALAALVPRPLTLDGPGLLAVSCR